MYEVCPYRKLTFLTAVVHWLSTLNRALNIVTSHARSVLHPANHDFNKVAYLSKID